MFEFTTSPDENYIISLAQHRHQFLLCANAIVLDSFNNTDRQLFDILISAYKHGNPALQYDENGFGSNEALIINIIELLDSELDKALSTYPHKLTNETVLILEDFKDNESYMYLRWNAIQSLQTTLKRVP